MRSNDKNGERIEASDLATDGYELVTPTPKVSGWDAVDVAQLTGAVPTLYFGDTSH
jgi:hypothetical protein